MLATTLRKHWERLAADPYFAVLTDHRYHREGLTEEALAEFFRSGQAHVDRVLEAVRSHVDPAFQPVRALDFGCGVGRVVIPLAAVAQHVVGVDVSETMLHEARRNCEARALSNVDLVLGDDHLGRVSGTFDFVHSFIVFQHIPVRRGELLLRRLIELLDDDGVGVVHFSYRTREPAWRRTLRWVQKSVPLAHEAINLVRGRTVTHPLTQMNAYLLNSLFGILRDSCCDEWYVRSTDHPPFDGAVLFFRKRRSGAW